MSLFKCQKCGKKYYNAERLKSHYLFIHGFLVPSCDTGINLKQFEHNQALRKDVKTADYNLKYTIKKISYHHKDDWEKISFKVINGKLKRIVNNLTDSTKKWLRDNIDIYLDKNDESDLNWKYEKIPSSLLFDYLHDKRIYRKIKTEIEIKGLVL